MANLTGAALLGVERDSLTGCSFSQWIIPNKREAFEKFLAQVFTGKDPVPIEVEVLKRKNRAHPGMGVCLFLVRMKRKGRKAF